MILSIIVILLIGVVAYFHYVQGFFTATISAICAVFAAVIAFGMHEKVVDSLLGGAAADYAHGMVLIALFALVYTVLRFAFDGFVPGNVRLPLYLEKGGAAVMGVIVGVFATGVWAVSAQLLPFGPSIAGYARQPLDSSRELAVPGANGRAIDRFTHGELIDDVFDATKTKTMIVPVDDMLVSFVSKLSGPTGSLSGAQPLLSVHPDFLLEAFGQRLGIQVGAKRVAYKSITLGGLYRVREVPQIQGELKDIKDRNLAPMAKGSDSETLLVVRVKIAPTALDDRDKKFRFSLGSVRLYVDGLNIYPLGTLEDGGILFASRLDDFLFVPNDKDGIDLVFRVNNAEVMQDPAAAKSGTPQLKDGAFVEIKRMGRVDVGGQPIGGVPKRDPKVGLQWKKQVLDTKPGAIKLDIADAPLDDFEVTVGNQLFTAINVGRGDRDATVDFTGGKATLVGRQFRNFNVDGTVSIQRLGAGEFAVKELMVPANKRIVQIKAARKGDPWKWADISKYELEDATGGKHKPVGAWAKVVVGTANHFIGAYDIDKGVSDVPQIDGTPSDVYIAFAVPENVTLSGLKFDGKAIATLTTQVR